MQFLNQVVCFVCPGRRLMPVLVPFSLGLQTIRRNHNILPITLMWIYGRIFDDNHGYPMTNDFAYRNNLGDVAVVFSLVASVAVVFSQVSSAVAMCCPMCSMRGMYSLKCQAWWTMCSLKYPGRWSQGGRKRRKWQRHPHPLCVCAAARGQLM